MVGVRKAHGGSRSHTRPAGEWKADAVGFLTVAESYTGVIEVEYLAR